MGFWREDFTVLLRSALCQSEFCSPAARPQRNSLALPTKAMPTNPLIRYTWGNRLPRRPCVSFPQKALKDLAQRTYKSLHLELQCAKSTFSKRSDLRAEVISCAQRLQGPGCHRAYALLVNCLHIPHPTSTWQPGSWGLWVWASMAWPHIDTSGSIKF